MISTKMKEDEDFVILPDSVWIYLFAIYGGKDCQRLSIQLNQEEDGEDAKKEFAIEIFLARLQLYILPKVKNHLSLRKPSSVFISRKATIQDFRRKVAEILFANKTEQTLEGLISMARIWRLETGESVTDIEKEYDNEIREKEHLPLPIRGRILEDKEVVENINVADNDVLLYEVQAIHWLKKENNMFAFIPKDSVQKQKREGNAIIKALGMESLTEEQIMKVSLDKCLDKSSRGGITGL